MAFMMPVMKNDWDIYNSQRSRRTSETVEKGGAVPGRMRKVSESRSEGPSFSSYRGASTLSPHRSAPAMRSLSYARPAPSKGSLRTPMDSPCKGSASPTTHRNSEKFQSRLVDKLRKALGRSDAKREERTS